ncbi:hypothetical protein ACQJBY_030942 [Aegilops geniculata]
METERRASSGKRASGAPPKVVAVLAGLLERAAKRGDAAVECGSGSAAFRGPTEKKPEIGVRRYAERIYRYAGCSPACFVVAYAYLDRLAAPSLEAEDAAVAVDSYSVHRLLITSVMVAAKFMDDIHYNNAYFARVGGVELREMNGLELEFLFALRFRLNVTPDDFASYCAALEGEMMATTTPPPLSPPAALASVSVSPEEEEEDAAAVAAGGSITAFAAAARVSVAEITQ